MITLVLCQLSFVYRILNIIHNKVDACDTLSVPQVISDMYQKQLQEFQIIPSTNAVHAVYHAFKDVKISNKIFMFSVAIKVLQHHS